MSKERLMAILLATRVSEKTTRLQKERQYVFKVHSSANKREVMASVEELFRVKVESVRICNVRGKKRRFGHSNGRKKDWKKAYVALREGHVIDLEVA